MEVSPTTEQRRFDAADEGRPREPRAERVLSDLAGRLGAASALLATCRLGGPAEITAESGDEERRQALAAHLRTGFAARVLAADRPVVEDLASGASYAIGAPVSGLDDSGQVFCVSFDHDNSDVDGSALRTVALYAGLLDLTLEFPGAAVDLLGSATRDPLTGCLNLAGLTDVLEREVRACERYGRPLSICFIDLDRFKEINDRGGHLRGNQVLAAVGDALHRNVRDADAVGRYGGDEFVVVLPETAADGASRCAQLLSQSIEATGRMILEGSLECSIGIAAWQPGLSAEAMLERADQALRAAKEDATAIVHAGSLRADDGVAPQPAPPAPVAEENGPAATRSGGAVLSLEDLPQGERLLEDSRSRLLRGLSDREWFAELVMAGGFIAAATAIAALMPSDRAANWPTMAALVLLMALCARVRFEVGSAYTMPVQLALVPMLLLLPPALVPFLVALSFGLDKGIDVIRGQAAAGRGVTALADSWFVIGPVLVIGLAAPGDPSLALWPIYLAALGAQFLGEAITSGIRERLHHGASLREQMMESSWIYLVDALLAPIGLVIAIAASQSGFAVLTIVPLAALLAVFARERADHVDSMLALRHAYRGTAHVLGDVVEHDDAYTGEHTRGVTDLALAVATSLGLDDVQTRNVEFGAILHDVGKIAIPKRIINKRGPLDELEWELIKTHTIEAQVMLDRIGGLMSGVGKIVRSAHERYDGAGYPDGLKGEDIPLESRIIFACDAFNAITTTRPYRRGRSESVAIAELRENAGSQFDPVVVDALVAVVRSNSKQFHSPGSLTSTGPGASPPPRALTRAARVSLGAAMPANGNGRVRGSEPVASGGKDCSGTSNGAVTSTSMPAGATSYDHPAAEAAPSLASAASLHPIPTTTENAPRSK